MSLFNVQINFEKAKLPKDFLKNISQLIAKSFSENVEIVNGSLTDNVNLSWRGSLQPMVFLTVQTIRDLSADYNQSCGAVLYKYLTNALNISEERIVIYFTEKVLSDVAIDGSLLIQCS